MVISYSARFASRGVYFPEECGRDGRQRLSGADVQDRSALEILAQRDIEKWLGSFAHALVLRVSDYADYSRPAALHLKPAADWILPAQ